VLSEGINRTREEKCESLAIFRVLKGTLVGF
jgi:hypothetical protein